MRKSVSLIGLTTLLGFFIGCAGPAHHSKGDLGSAEIEQYLADKPHELQSRYRLLLEEGDRNKVLNLMRLGVEALESGYRDQAAQAFDGALNGIELVYANSEKARTARSLWVEEGKKDFKGEPYERAMAYYYRGLLYIWDGDYQNARACFKGGMLQDAFAEEQQHRCDFALMLYLSGWCSQRIKDDILTQAAFEEVKSLRPSIALPKRDDNLLLVIETGTAPRKLSDGVGHYQLKFRRGRGFSEIGAQYRIDDGSWKKVHPVEDVFWQASTRGGRQFDCILEGKAQFKKQTETVGSTVGDMGAGSMIAATVFENSASELQGVGAALGLVSVVSMASSAKMRSEADTRYWDNLPDTVHVASRRITPGQHKIEIQFLDQGGNTIEELTKVIDLNLEKHKPKLVWVRSRN
jgi:tetratricopeptide (TPR) repeat protein